MTLPEQSDRAVKQTREFLVRLASPFVEGGIKGIRREVRAEALRLLRHYPYVWSGGCPDSDNAANADIFTDEEREAVEFAICSLKRDDYLNERFAERLAETLERLNERLK